jgi:hypothetical protein
MKSWKIGALAGLIAGIVYGIINSILTIYILETGLPFYTIPITPIPNVGLGVMIIDISWSVGLGIIYSKIYHLIPGKTISKGLIYGLGLCLIFYIRNMTFFYFYSNIPPAIHALMSSFIPIVFGLVLGVLYEFLHNRYYPIKEELKIKKYRTWSGIYPGAFAGLAGGLVTPIGNLIFIKELYPRYAEDIGFFIGQTGTHVFFDMIWGIIFGIIFVRFYEEIPGKGIFKGIVFGTAMFFMTTLRGSFYFLANGQITWFLYLVITSYSMYLVFGLVLGYLYKPPK